MLAQWVGERGGAGEIELLMIHSVRLFKRVHPSLAITGEDAGFRRERTERTHDNKHYLSDVIFGAAMGIAAERTVTLHAGRYSVNLAPSAGPSRVGMTAIRPGMVSTISRKASSPVPNA